MTDDPMRLHEWVSLPMRVYDYVICGYCGVTQNEIEDNLGHQRCYGSPRARVAVVALDIAKRSLQKAKDNLADAQREYDAAVKAAQEIVGGQH